MLPNQPILSILCPTDFSEASLQTLSYAGELALLWGSELHLLHVVEPLQPALGIVSVEEFNQEPCQQALQRMDVILAERVPASVRVRSLVRLGDAATEITRAATQEKMGLIVIATHGRSGWRHLAMGSVAESVVRSAPCPVVTLTIDPQREKKLRDDGDAASATSTGAAHHAANHHLPVRRILCPVDFSDASHEALHKAGELAAQFGAELLVLHVVPEAPGAVSVPFADPYASMMLASTMQPDTDSIGRDLQKLVKRLVPGREVNCLLAQGSAAHEIQRVAAEQGVDMIVIATHGLTGWRHLVFGSVTEQVVRQAACPVFTIRCAGQSGNHDDSYDSRQEHEEPSPQSNPSVQATLATDEKHAMTESNSHPNCMTQAEFAPETAIEFPAEGSDEDKLRFLLNYALLAPSNRNTQPWQWEIAGDTISLFTDPSRSLPYLDPLRRELIISCGAALQHLQIAIQHFGHSALVKVLPDSSDPGCLARIQLAAATPDSQAAAQEEGPLFEAMRGRHTNRYPFLQRELPTTLKDALQAEARRETAWLVFIEDAQKRFDMISLIARGDHLQGSNQEIVEETADWVRPAGGSDLDGIPLAALGKGGPPLRYAMDAGEVQADKDQLLTLNASALVVLGTDDDTPCGWLAVGQALARVLLRAGAHDVQASFFNTPVEVVENWAKLHHILGRAGFPQMIFRLGYPAIETSATPRRPVDEVVRVVEQNDDQ